MFIHRYAEELDLCESISYLSDPTFIPPYRYNAPSFCFSLISKDCDRLQRTNLKEAFVDPSV